jgi:Flp pilus assembly protein TadG
MARDGARRAHRRRDGDRQVSRPSKSLARDRSGASVVEFAMLSPVLIFTVVSVIQLGINYMETSAVQTGAFLLARAISSSSSPPTDAASAKAIVLSANMATQKAQDVIVSVSALQTSAMSAMPTQPTADSFSLPGASSAVLVRVVAKRTSLLPFNLLASDAWSSIVNKKIDYSVISVTPNA